MEVNVRKPTREDNFYLQLSVEMPKHTMDAFDKFFPAIMTISGLFLGGNLLFENKNLFILLPAFLSLLFSFIGLYPLPEKVIPLDIVKLKSYLQNRVKQKRILANISTLALLYSFGVTLGRLFQL